MRNNNHPKALPYLFFTEMWERFGYYLMLGLFVLYLIEPNTAAINPQNAGGFEMPKDFAYDVFGTFIALVFLTPFVGGLIADRYLGYTKSIIIGAILMGAGYCTLAIHNLNIFYLGCLLIILGNGFFKPNISTLLGNLYNSPEYKDKKDAGYNIFYMGINIGALVCNFIAAYFRNKYGWGAAFAAAGVGMFIGLIIFLLGLKHYKAGEFKTEFKNKDKSFSDIVDDNKNENTPDDMPFSQIIYKVFLPVIIFALIGWFIPGTIFKYDSTDAFIFSSIPVIYFYYNLYARANEKEKKPISALLIIMLVSVMFWAVFKQNGTALNTWAKYYTDREAPSAIAPIMDSLKLTETVKGNVEMVKVYDKNFNIVKDDSGKAIMELGRDIYFRNLPVDKAPPMDSDLKVINTEIYQSINPFWVVALTPLVVAFFMFLKRRKNELTTPSKIAWGLLISALSPLVMIAAVMACQNGLVKASSWWLWGTYGVITVGELFLSPMGLSLVSKLSPKRLTSLMMGGWFLSTSLGNKLSGILASLWDVYDNKAYYFLTNSILLLISAAAIFYLLKNLNKIFNEYSS